MKQCTLFCAYFAGKNVSLFSRLLKCVIALKVYILVYN